MPSIYDIKPAFQSVLRPATRLLASRGVNANQITVLAAVGSVGAGVLIAWRHDRRFVLAILPIALFIRMALNAIDGMLAREHNMKTNLGAVLNEISDVVADGALYLPLALTPWLDPIAVVSATMLAIITEMTGVVGIQIGASRRYDGPMGKSDRAFTFGVLALLIACGVPGGWWFDAVVWTIAALSGLTILNRARCALGEVETTPKKKTDARSGGSRR